MKDLLRNIRFYILFFSIGLSFLYLLWAKMSFGSERLETIRIQQLSALTAVTFLYVALMIGPFTYVFKGFRWRAGFVKARRALGVSAFYFGAIHGVVSFFGQLGGFGGLGFLSTKYIIAISLSFTALIILFFMTITSFDRVIEKIGYKKWKILHRFVYLAGVLVLIHALMLGTHFQDLSGVIPQIFISMFFILLLFETSRFDYYLRSKFTFYPKIGFTTSLVVVGFGVWLLLPYISKSGVPSFGIHSQHMKGLLGVVGNSAIQKRYSVVFDYPKPALPGEELGLSFSVFDASNAAPVTDFNLLHEKELHLIIVDEDLVTFSHLHPERNKNIFAINTTFVKDGNYRVYADFEPSGGSEQQFAFRLKVGESTESIVELNNNEVEKTIDKYLVKLIEGKVLNTFEISAGTERIVFEIQNTESGQPVTTLKPYLGAFGHLVMINTKTFQYIHVHPIETPATFGPNGGPSVSFVPMGLYEPIIPGTYRIFAEFNPDNSLIMAPFTVTVE